MLSQQQGGRGSDIGPEDVRPAQLNLGDELGQELAHRPRRQELLAAFRCAEPGQVDREEAGVVGKRGPDRRDAYTLSGQGLVSRTVRSCEPPLSAYRIRAPSTVRKALVGLWS